jgi:hypothetical protein
MTRAERAEWSKLTNEGEAVQFIAKFLAGRGPTFAADVAAAAKDADEYLSVAGKRGSRTLRGKIAIVLGRPSSVTIAPWSGDKSATMASIPSRATTASSTRARPREIDELLEKAAQAKRVTP